MRKKLVVLLLIFFFFLESSAQDFIVLPLTNSKKEKRGLIYHYYSKIDSYSGSHLYLYSTGKFSYETYTDLLTMTSSGLWINKKDTLYLTSEFRKNTLPVKVVYLTRDSSQDKKLAIIKDLVGREYFNSAIHVNNDSVSCYYGDGQCFGSFDTLDSIKITISDYVTSGWIKVDATKGIIQPILQTDIDLNNYFPLDLKLRKRKDKLEYIKN